MNMQRIPVFKAHLDKAKIDAAAEVVQRRGYVREWGGRFVTAVPKLEVA